MMWVTEMHFLLFRPLCQILELIVDRKSKSLPTRVLAFPVVYVVDREEALRAQSLVSCLESDLTGWLISSLIRQKETTQMRGISGHCLIFIQIKADKRKLTRGIRHACVRGMCTLTHTLCNAVYYCNHEDSRHNHEKTPCVCKQHSTAWNLEPLQRKWK